MFWPAAQQKGCWFKHSASPPESCLWMMISKSFCRKCATLRMTFLKMRTEKWLIWKLNISNWVMTNNVFDLFFISLSWSVENIHEGVTEPPEWDGARNKQHSNNQPWFGGMMLSAALHTHSLYLPENLREAGVMDSRQDSRRNRTCRINRKH